MALELLVVSTRERLVLNISDYQYSVTSLKLKQPLKLKHQSFMFHHHLLQMPFLRQLKLKWTLLYVLPKVSQLLIWLKWNQLWTLNQEQDLLDQTVQVLLNQENVKLVLCQVISIKRERLVLSQDQELWLMKQLTKLLNTVSDNQLLLVLEVIHLMELTLLMSLHALLMIQKLKV